VKTRIVDLPFLDHPYAVFERLVSRLGARHACLLESLSGPAADVRGSMITLAPALRVRVKGSELALAGDEAVVASLSTGLLAAGVVGDSGGTGRLRLFPDATPLDALRAIQRQFTLELPSAGLPPFVFGFCGYFGYDLVRHLERLPARLPDDLGCPDISLILPRVVLYFDHRHGPTRLFFHQIGGDPGQGLFGSVLAILSEPLEEEEYPDPPLPRSTERDNMTKTAFLERVHRAKEHIRAGDIYQVQVGHRVTVATPLSPALAYRRLRRINPSPYMCFLSLDDVTLVGCSPELHLRVEEDRLLMRPLAGTIRRGSTPEEDRVLAQALLADPKERAEHVMLVDLCRNDVGRVSVPGSLRVDTLLAIERYSHVSHIVSSVSGLLEPRQDAYDALAATFPSGTLSGAPKVRAMEIIEELEVSRRGPYGGVMGVVDFRGNLTLAITIRTAVHLGGEYHLQAAAGIVADSEPEKEWQETLQKLAVLRAAMTGEAR
jgi:anthranilate synthase component 1